MFNFKNDNVDRWLETAHRYRFKILGALIGFSIFIGLLFTPYIVTKGFGPRTFVNHFDVSNMSVDDAVQLIENDAYISILENDVLLVNAPMKDLGYSLSDEQKEFLKNESKSYITLVDYLIGSRKISLNYEPKLSSKVVIDFLYGYGLTNENRVKSQDAYIQLVKDDKTGNASFFIEPEKIGNFLNFDRLDTVLSKLSGSNLKIDLNALYDMPVVLKDDSVLNEQLQVLSSKFNRTIEFTYKGSVFYQIIPSGVADLYDFSNGSIQLNEYALSTMIQYMTGSLSNDQIVKGYGFNFNSTDSGSVFVQGGTLGIELNADEIKRKLMDVLNVDGDVTIELGEFDASSVELYKTGTYVEVDLSTQYLYYYENGFKVLETPIVSGRIGTDTVPGAYFVNDKQSPSVLVGYNPHTNVDYQQPVDYWMPFDYTGQGIHDANWQPTFGGDAYLNNGSLGCINIPPTMMPFLYESVRLGTPVIIF